MPMWINFIQLNDKLLKILFQTSISFDVKPRCLGNTGEILTTWWNLRLYTCEVIFTLNSKQLKMLYTTSHNVFWFGYWVLIYEIMVLSIAKTLLTHTWNHLPLSGLEVTILPLTAMSFYVTAKWLCNVSGTLRWQWNNSFLL